MKRRSLLLALFLAVASGAAAAADLLAAVYDPRTDSIVAEIAYRGTRPDHDFHVLWGECKGDGVAARLVDEQGEDVAMYSYRVTERIDLSRIPCRPALVTLRLGRVSHLSVRVPD